MYVQTRESSWNTISSTPEPDWPQQDHPATCVIAQRYSSVIFLWFLLSCPQGKIRSACKICYYFRFFFFFFFKNCVIPKLRDLKLLKSASVSYAINVDRRVLTRVREAVSNMTGHGQGVLLHVSCSIGHSVRLFGCLIGSYLGRCRHDFIESRRHSFLSRSAFEIMNATLQWSKTMCHAVCTFTYYLRFTQKYIRAFMLFCISLNY